MPRTQISIQIDTMIKHYRVVESGGRSFPQLWPALAWPIFIDHHA